METVGLKAAHLRQTGYLLKSNDYPSKLLKGKRQIVVMSSEWVCTPVTENTYGQQRTEYRRWTAKVFRFHKHSSHWISTDLQLEHTAMIIGCKSDMLLTTQIRLNGNDFLDIDRSLYSTQTCYLISLTRLSTPVRDSLSVPDDVSLILSAQSVTVVKYLWFFQHCLSCDVGGKCISTADESL